MILYYPTKFRFDTMKRLELRAAATSPLPPPSPRAQAPKKSPGQIGLREIKILVQGKFPN